MWFGILIIVIIIIILIVCKKYHNETYRGMRSHGFGAFGYRPYGGRYRRYNMWDRGYDRRYNPWFVQPYPIYDYPYPYYNPYEYVYALPYSQPDCNDKCVSDYERCKLIHSKEKCQNDLDACLNTC